MLQITCQRKHKILGHSIKHPSSGNRHKDVVLLHRELYLNLNRHIRHGRALKNIGFGNHEHKIPTGVRQNAERPGKSWSFERRIGNKKSRFVTCRISNIGHILGCFR